MAYNWDSARRGRSHPLPPLSPKPPFTGGVIVGLFRM